MSTFLTKNKLTDRDSKKSSEKTENFNVIKDRLKTIMAKSDDDSVDKTLKTEGRELYFIDSLFNKNFPDNYVQIICDLLKITDLSLLYQKQIIFDYGGLSRFVNELLKEPIERIKNLESLQIFSDYSKNDEQRIKLDQSNIELHQTLVKRAQTIQSLRNTSTKYRQTNDIALNILKNFKEEFEYVVKEMDQWEDCLSNLKKIFVFSEDMKERFDYQQKEMNELKEKNIKLDEKVQNLLNVQKSLKNENYSLRLKIEKNDTYFTKVDSELSSFNSIIEKKTTDSQGVQSETETENDTETKMNLIENLSKELGELRVKVKDLNFELLNSQKQNEKLMSYIEEQKQQKEKEPLISNLSKKLVENQQQNAVLRKQVNDLTLLVEESKELKLTNEILVKESQNHSNKINEIVEKTENEIKQLQSRYLEMKSNFKLKNNVLIEEKHNVTHLLNLLLTKIESSENSLRVL
eukprot:TRINITY_DN3078_c0_g1_i1.p1 TRINITY_DN3078_c0_g1~~TRINITY_DN3078_c0_g1_i1.p1  ORF type:complete len:482 (+),score=170.41 TRINITY_DN3078_c0_g1_i1:59-1447(+)